MKPQPTHQPSVPEQIIQVFNNLDAQQRNVLLGGLILLFVLFASTTLLLAYYIYQPEIGGLFQSPTPTLTPSPTPQCVRPTLTLGTTSYPLDVVSPIISAPLPTPAGPAGIAWWVSNTFSPFVFELGVAAGSPDPQSTLIPGDSMVVQWADCGQEGFIYTGVLPLSSEDTLIAQAAPGIAVIIRPGGSQVGYILYGQRPELLNPATPEPTLPNAISVDINFGETSLSADGKTLLTRLTINNRGSQYLTLANNDFSLNVEGQAPESPLLVIPALTQELQPGASLAVVLTFANPGGHTAVLRVLDTTVDIYY